MGKHYVPQYYLKGFSIPGDINKIVTFNCETKQNFTTNIINIAQETDFYTEESENYLANKIEGPANEILKKIKSRKELSTEDRQTLTNYLVVTLKRVPSFYNIVKTYYPDSIDIVINQLKKQYELLNDQNKIDVNELININKGIEQIGEQYKSDERKSKEIWENNIAPETTPLIQNEILSRNWVFFCLNSDQYFLTCDNPFFFFQEMGLKYSEISIPISKEIALWVPHTEENLPNYAIPRIQLVKEINRRTIFNARNFVFSPHNEEWILNIINKKENIHLSKINIDQ